MNKNVKYLLTVIGVWVALTLLAYVCIAFVQLECNPFKWTEFTRVGLVFLSCFALWASFFIVKIFD